MNTKLFRKGDLIVIAAILIFAAAFMAWSNSKSESPQAVITVNGETVEMLDLQSVKEKIIIKPETTPEVVIVAENGKIRFESAECEDKLCIASGILSKHGDTAVCLPAKTAITVTGSDVDAVVY